MLLLCLQGAELVTDCKLRRAQQLCVQVILFGEVKVLAKHKRHKKTAAHGKSASKNRRTPVYLGITAAAVIYFAVTVISQQLSLSEQNRTIDALNGKISEAQQTGEALKSEVDNLNNPEYIEHIAREQLGLVRPNERVFIDSNKSENNK